MAIETRLLEGVLAGSPRSCVGVVRHAPVLCMAQVVRPCLISGGGPGVGHDGDPIAPVLDPRTHVPVDVGESVAREGLPAHHVDEVRPALDDVGDLGRGEAQAAVGLGPFQVRAHRLPRSLVAAVEIDVVVEVPREVRTQLDGSEERPVMHLVLDASYLSKPIGDGHAVHEDITAAWWDQVIIDLISQIRTIYMDFCA